MTGRIPGSSSDLSACHSCGALVPNTTGPVHKYLDAPPGCWAIYGDVLAREFSDYRYMPIHQYTVDAYAVQHPGQPSPQTQQSIAVHLVSMHLIIERGLKAGSAAQFKRQLTKRKADLFWLEPPTDLGQITVQNLWASSGVEEHTQLARAWAYSAWSAWSEHHAQVEAWVNSLLKL